MEQDTSACTAAKEDSVTETATAPVEPAEEEKAEEKPTAVKETMKRNPTAAAIFCGMAASILLGGLLICLRIAQKGKPEEISDVDDAEGSSDE